jgi:acyl-CoA synthetase (AMP-forming)/AMP-acid ligase II
MRFDSHQAFLNRFAPFGFKESALCTCYAMAENVFAVTQGGIDHPLLIDVIDREGMQQRKLAQPALKDLPSIKMVSAGRPIRNVEVKVMDEQGRELPDRHIGELALRSDSMMTEYYHRRSHEKASKRWYFTGYFGTR